MNYKNVDKETYYRKGVFKHFTQDCKCSTSITVLASGEISHLLSGENDQSQSDRNNQCISFSFL